MRPHEDGGDRGGNAAWPRGRGIGHRRLCALARLPLRTGLPWARIAHLLGTLKAVRDMAESRTIVRRTKIAGDLVDLLKKLGIPLPKEMLAVTAAAEPPVAAYTHARNPSFVRPLPRDSKVGRSATRRMAGLVGRRAGVAQP
jgi:hypothetical protein